jgi:hypothetical protein
MRVMALTLAAVTAVAILALRLLQREQERASPRNFESQGVARPAVLQTQEGLATPDREPLRAIQERDEIAEPALAVPVGPIRTRLSGRALDLQGNGREGLGVAFAGADAPEAYTDANGAFELSLDRPRAGRLVILDSDWATVRGSDVDPALSGVEHLILVAPSIDVDGHVVDEGLKGIEGARIVVEFPPGALVGFPFALGSTTVTDIYVDSGPDGRFEFRGLAGVQGTELDARHPDFPDVRVRIPTQDCHGLLIEMRPPGTSGPRVVGTVVSPEGTPVAGADVALGGHTARTNVQGRFVLALTWIPPLADLVAVAPGFQPAILVDYSTIVAEAGGSPPPLWVVLGTPTLRITGRVVREGGAPASGMRVSIVDGTPWLPGSMPPTWLESMAAGSDRDTRTAEDGSFALEGLSERDYRVQAWSAETLELVRSGPVPAGTEGLVLTLLRDPYHESIRGRVILPSGEPCASARVAAHLVYVETALGSDSVEGPFAVTDAEGSFELLRVPRSSVRLEVTGTDLMPVVQPLSEEDARRPLEIVAPPRCHFRVECPSDAEVKPDGLRALDERGERVPLFSFASNEWMGSTFVRLDDGRSSVLSQAPGSYVLVSLRSGEEIARLAMDLAPSGDVLTVRCPAN